MFSSVTRREFVWKSISSFKRTMVFVEPMGILIFRHLKGEGVLIMGLHQVRDLRCLGPAFGFGGTASV